MNRHFHPLFLILLGALLGAPARAAEPTISPGDLPSIAPTEPARALDTFRIKTGFHLDLVAAEPLVMDPVAMAFDEEGRLFVVEMRDYSERRDEHLGRIRLLEDTDGDGRFDKSTVYADQLPWPTAVICWKGGVFVGATPDIIFFKDSNGDGVADTREVAFTGFGNRMEKLNVQQLLNSFAWGQDNRIHGATGGNVGVITTPSRPDAPPVELRGRDFSFDPRSLELRAETGGAQHGMSFDDWGRRFVCSNSAHIQMLMYEESCAGRNPAYAMPRALVDIAEDGPAAEVFRISPDEPWRVIRTKWRVTGKVPGLIEGGGRPSGYFTAATGVTIYRGDAFPEEFRGDAFVGDCGSNLIHRKKLYPDGVGFNARRPADEQKVEFIASTDNWFRPVQFANAPDGTLYVADMYRETIEHPWSLPEPLKSLLDLNSGNERGRIYRIAPDGFKQPKLPKLASASISALVQTLEHPNGWWRDTAARLLYERQDRTAVEALERLLAGSKSPLAREHVLQALAGLHALTENHVVVAMKDASPRVRERAVQLAGLFVAHGSRPAALTDALTVLPKDPDARVRYETAFAVGGLDLATRLPILLALMHRDAADRWMRAAVFSSLKDGAAELFELLERQESASQPGIPATSPRERDAFLEFQAELATVIGTQGRERDLEMLFGYFERVEFQPALASAFTDGLQRARFPNGLPPSVADRWQALARRAAVTAADSRQDDTVRASATRLMTRLPWSEAGPTLLLLADGTNNPPVQLAALTATIRFNDRDANDQIIQRWPRMAPQSRGEFLTAALARTDRAGFVLEAIETGRIQVADLSSTQIDQLKRSGDPSVRDRAARLFPAPTDSRAEMVAKMQSALDLDGIASRGREVFIERCASCHQLHGEGSAVGPDLASARSSGKAKMLVSIIDPGREVPPAFINYAVDTTSGESFSGIIATESSTSLTLRRAFNDQTVIPRANIQRIQGSGLSLMPEGLETGLSPQDLADLIEFITVPKL